MVNFTFNIKAVANVDDVISNVSNIQKALNQLKLPPDLQSSFKQTFSDLQKELTKYQNLINNGIKTKGDANALTKSGNNILRLYDSIQKKINSLDGSALKRAFQDIGAAEVKNLKDQLTSLEATLKSKVANIDLSAAKNQLQDLRKQITFVSNDAKKDFNSIFNSRFDTFAKNLGAGRFDLAEKNLEGIRQKVEAIKNTQLTDWFNTLNNAFQKLQQDPSIKETVDKIQQLKQNLASIEVNTLQSLINQFNTGKISVEELKNQIANLTSNTKAWGDAQASTNSQLAQVKSRIQYFLGLNNAVNLVKRGIQSAFNTIKDLDKAMTETAVVTDMTVSDMWNKLPEYTKRANELGVNTLEAYQAATLYYQQGLNDTQAAELSEETLRMARIAGLEAAEATDRMTNALRGFNMELNNINAQRIDDVYSKLAAISASDVDEISTAMTKVASLAHNANMDFETTAAFLAQIIETTRESAETAGTALKTVIARFSEVKKLVSEDQLKGTDEEGQAIDVNKVSAALRSVGIDLNKYFAGEVGLDDIFLELASKWDSLTSVQQRYIATQAAGSRQQSRFIAMMQDYARTQELVSAAYNANGASAEQFEKTQDSLQSKLARLKNAWNQFLMGITNSSVVKFAVDALTFIINRVNDLTEGFGILTGSVGGFISGLLKLSTAALGLAALRKIFSEDGIVSKGFKAFGNSRSGKFLGKLFGFTSQADAEKAASVQLQAAEQSKGIQVEAATRSGQIAVNAATEAGEILKQAAVEAGRIEVQSEAAGGQADAAGEITGSALQTGSKMVPMMPAPSSLPSTGGATGKASTGLLGKLGAKLGTKGGLIAVAALALAAEIYGTVKLIQAYNARYKRRLERAEKLSKNIGNQSRRIQEQQLKMQDAQKEYADYTEKVEGATTISQRSQTIQDRNDYITSLLEQNAAYAKYIHTTFENGEIVLTLDSDALAAAVDKIAEGATRAKAYASGTEAATALSRQEYYEDQFANKTSNTSAGIATGLPLTWLLGLPWGIIAGVLAGTYTSSREVNYDKTREDFDTDVEYAAYLRNVQAAQSAEQQSQAYIEQAAAAFVKNENLDDETSNIITTYLGKNFDVRQLQGAIEALTMLYGGSSDAELRKRYANYYGTEADSEMSHEDLVSAVASAAALEMGLGTQVTNLSTLLTGENGEAYKKILSAAVGGADIENIDLSNINFDGDFSLDKIFGKGFSDSVSKLEETMGLETGTLQKQIVEQLKLTQQIQRETKQRIVENSAKAGANLTKDQLTQISEMKPQQARQLEAITSKASGLLDTEGYNDLITKLLSGSDEFDWDKTQDLLSDIDLSDPINAFLRLEEAINSDDEALSNLAKNIKNVNSVQLSGSALTQDFINSESYEQLTESLSKFLEKNNEISSTNILELAESNAKLNNLLKTGVITAKALAVALTGIESGTIAVTDLTSSVISALNGLDDLDGAVKRTIDDLNNFDPGYDENDVTSFITKVYEFSKEQMSKGAYGNNQMNQYMAKLFGAFDPTAAEFSGLNYEQAHQAWLQRNLDWLEANSKNMSSAWRDLIASTSGGFRENVRVWEENGEIFIDAAGHTTDQLIQILSEGSQLTEEQVRMMVADFKNYSDEFAYVMAQNDLPNAVKAWADSLPKNSSGEIFYLDKDLKTLATLLGVDTEDILGILNEYSKGVKELEWGEGTTEDIVKILNTIRGEKAQYAIKENGSYALGEGLINYDDLKKEMDNANLPEYFEQTLNEMVGEGETFTATINGKLEKIEVKAGETAADAYNRTVEEISMENYADAIGMSVAKALADITVNLDTSGAAAKIQALTELLPSTLETSVEINNATAAAIGARAVMESILTRPLDVPISVKPAGASGGTVTGGGKRGPSSTTALSMAGGTSSHKLTPGPALTGEEAPEIVWNKEKGYAYITGAHGPQFQNLKPGDQVFNGQETKKILNNTGRRENLFGSYVNGRKKQITSTWFIQDEGSGKKVTIEDRTTQASAYGKETLTGSGSGNNNNNNKNSDDWKNDLDWLYDLMEDIAEEERHQSFIQEEYELSLKDLNKTGKDLYDLTKQELSSLMTQLDAQQFAYEKRLQQMNELQAEANDKGYQKYIQWNPDDQTLEIDWDKIEDLTDKDTYEAIRDLLSEMEKVQGQMDDAEKSIWDIKKQIQEIQTRYLEKYLDFQQKVLDAIVKSYQDNIDKLNSLNDTIKEANDSILDSIQKEVDLQRQIRDNTETESGIYDMENRLAYLLRDTTGANQKEIQELQKQLKEARENYSDSLIDQNIKRLQDDNDDAAEQRQQQIDLLEAQLEYWQETGALWAEVAQLIVDGFTSSGSIIEGSALWEFLKRADSWDGLSEAQKKNWANELILEANEVGAHLIQLSGGIDIDTDKVINSIADINGILTEDISVKLEQVRAILAEIGTLGGTPEHSNHEGYGYSTGGLNTHPGMAMLHGTPTDPEYVLNARQTQAFLRLADVLPTVVGDNNTANNFGSNIYVEFNMNVGEIGSDYDVDRIVERVEEDIYAASTYRNVNVVSFQR